MSKQVTQDNNNPTARGEQIKLKRLRLNMTQKELADAVGMPKFGDRTIRRWEKGESSPSELEYRAILNFPEHIPFPNVPNKVYTMIDLFAGIGGTRLGFLSTNQVSVVFSSEIDKFSCKTYRANFGESPSGDITSIAAKDVPDHNILVAGFPCQAFSMAGKKKGFDDVRGTMFFEIARILKEKKPECFLLENVKNLKNHNRGDTFRTIRDVLDSLGYETCFQVLAARDFGLPQNRERIYIVGFNREKVNTSEPFNFPNPTKSTTRFGLILENQVSDKYTISDTLWNGHQMRKESNKNAGKGFEYSLFNENSVYVSTLSARYYKDGSEILIEQEGKNPRKITPREAARLQGFPEEFIIPVSDTQAYRQFGNSVAIPVIAAIAHNILKYLELHKVKQKKSCLEGDSL